MRRKGGIEASASVEAIIALVIIMLVASIGMNIVIGSVGQSSSQNSERRSLGELSNAIENKCDIATGNQYSDTNVGRTSIEITYQTLEAVRYERGYISADYKGGDTIEIPTQCSIGVSWRVEGPNEKFSEGSDATFDAANTWQFVVSYDDQASEIVVEAHRQ